MNDFACAVCNKKFEEDEVIFRVSRSRMVIKNGEPTMIQQQDKLYICDNCNKVIDDVDEVDLFNKYKGEPDEQD